METIPAQAEPESEPETLAVEEIVADAGKAAGKLKNLLGRFKRTG